jgi:hypothetical protein
VKWIAWVLIAGSLTAFAFLGYSLLNLERLGIGPTHPRVLVEAFLGVALAIGGVALLR